MKIEIECCGPHESIDAFMGDLHNPNLPGILDSVTILCKNALSVVYLQDMKNNDFPIERFEVVFKSHLDLRMIIHFYDDDGFELRHLVFEEGDLIRLIHFYPNHNVDRKQFSWEATPVPATIKYTNL